MAMSAKLASTGKVTAQQLADMERASGWRRDCDDASRLFLGDVLRFIIRNAVWLASQVTERLQDAHSVAILPAPRDSQ